MKQYFTIYFVGMLISHILLYFFLRSITLIPEPFFTEFFIIKACIGLGVSGFVFLLLLRYYQLRIKTLFYLIGMLISFLVYDLFYALSFFTINSNNAFYSSLAKFLALIGNFFFILIVGWLVLFISYYSKKIIQPYILLPVSLALGVYIAYVFTGNMFIMWHFTINNQTLYYYLSNPSLLDYQLIMSFNFSYFGMYSFLHIWTSKKRTKDPLLRLEQNLFILCVSFTSILAPLIILLPIYVFKDSYFYFITLYVILSSLAMLVFLIIMLPFTLAKKRVYLQPPPIHWFIISRIGGNPVFYYHFSQIHEKKEELETSTFLSGIITAVDTVMRVHIKMDTQIQAMTFSDKILLIRLNEDLRFILVTEFETSFILKSLEFIAHEIPKVFKKEIDECFKTGKMLLNNGDIINFVHDKLGY